MVRQSDLVVWLKDIDREDIHLVGEKSAHLGDLVQNKFPVLPGFVLTAAAYTTFIKENRLEKPIAHLLHSINYSDPNSLAQVANHIKKLIVSAPFSKELSTQLFKFYERLDTRTQNPAVAIRTSVLSVHAAMPSTVVPHDSLLNIKGESSVANAIRQVWSTAYDAHALHYRHTHQERESGIKMAVIIQKMVNAESSGLLFTTHPTTGDKKLMIIEAVLGLGDHLKNKHINPDLYEVSKEILEITKKQIRTQSTMLVNAKEQYKEVTVPKKQQSLQKINDNHIITLAQLGKKLENHYFYPQDIEWSIEGSQIFIMETRPLMQSERTERKIDKNESTLFSQSHTVRSLLIGEPGSPGIGVGPVRVITKLSDLNVFKPGEVLVTDKTSPQFELAMRRASALVVEAGGRTSHAASMARQFGVPAIVGVPNARATLKSGTVITVKGNSGEILKGNLKLLSAYSPDPSQNYKSRTKIYVELTNTSLIEKLDTLPIDGVGALYGDTLIRKFGIHPKKVLQDKKTAEFTAYLTKEIGTVAKSIYPKPLIFSLSNGTVDMYRTLAGGKDFEPFKEKNELIGYRGSFRHLNDLRVLELELSVIKSVRAFGYNNVQIRIPFTRSVREFELMKKVIHTAGFRRNATSTLWMTCSTPANVLEIDEYIRTGLDGVYVDAGLLSQLIIGYDKDNFEISHAMSQLSPAVLWAFQHVITQCKKKKVNVIFSSSSISLTPDLAEKLVEWDIDTISTFPESVHHIRENIVGAERNILKSNK